MAAQRVRILKFSLLQESISAAHAFDMPGPTKPAAIHLYPYPHTCRTKQSFASIRPLLTFPSMQGSVRFPQVPRCHAMNPCTAATGGSRRPHIRSAMYQYTEFDKQFIRLRAEQFRDQLRSEEHTSELQSPCNLVCRLLLE